MYQEIQNGIKDAKSDEVICIMRDLNAKVGDERYQNIVGMHCSGQIFNLRTICERATDVQKDV